MMGLKSLYDSLYFGKWFYRLLGTTALLFLFSYGLPFLFPAASVFLVALAVAVLLDFGILYSGKQPVTAVRILPERLSNGEENFLRWEISNRYPVRIVLQLVDEFPEAWQIRNFKLRFKINAGEKVVGEYRFIPLQRGEYSFGDLHAYVKSPLRLITRRHRFKLKHSARIFPAFHRLHQFEFMAHATDPGNIGFKQVRKTGHSAEYEQIREFVSGDDIRSINWRATARAGGQLMLNTYTDEKSQQVYCIIDKGRSMKMAFDGMTLLDYAVNAVLAMSSVAITRQDKAGLISFGDRSGDFLASSLRPAQLSAIVQSLYNLNTQFRESDFAFLHKLVKTHVTRRSLLILFTNFESMTALRRQMPYLRNISGKHLLLVVFFENTSLRNLVQGEANDIETLYEKVIAEKFILEKRLIVKELQQFGIPSLLTDPGKLTVDVINNYLQIKARREI